MLALLAALILLLPGRAAALQCREPVEQWLSSCRERTGLELKAQTCLSQGLVLEARAPAAADAAAAAPLRVEIARRAEGGFVRARGLAISPVGEFPDWKREPKPVRELFERVLGCVQADEGALLVGQAPAKTSAPTPTEAPPLRAQPPSSGSGGGLQSPQRVPWLLILGLFASGIIALLAKRPRAWELLLFPVAVGALVALRAWMAPWGFFHQNGQGPLFIIHALGGALGHGSYGPGFAEVFGWTARSSPARAELAVFAAQSVLGAVSTLAAYGLARGLGASRPLALAAVAVLAFDPLLARIFGSESYFATQSALYLLASSVLVSAARAQRLGLLFVGTLAAGLLASQAVRLHPLGYPAAALVPLGVLLVPASRPRILETLIVTVGVGAVIGVTSGGAMLAVLEGPLGQKFLPSLESELHGRLLRFAPLGALVLLALGAQGLPERWRRVVWALALLALTAGVMLSANVIHADLPRFQGALQRLYLGPMLAALVTLPAALEPRSVWAVTLPAAIAGAALGFYIDTWGSATTRATGVLEADWCRHWRRDLPPGATVAYLSRAERRVLVLPLYREGGDVRPVALTRSLSLQPGTFYYRSSLCSTDAGRALCREFEARHGLEPVHKRTLPGVPSHAAMPLGPEPVEVALFRVIPSPDEPGRLPER